jgi:hypothetical protein
MAENRVGEFMCEISRLSRLCVSVIVENESPPPVFADENGHRGKKLLALRRQVPHLHFGRS